MAEDFLLQPGAGPGIGEARGEGMERLVALPRAVEHVAQPHAPEHATVGIGGLFHQGLRGFLRGGPEAFGDLQFENVFAQFLIARARFNQCAPCFQRLFCATGACLETAKELRCLERQLAGGLGCEALAQGSDGRLEVERARFQQRLLVPNISTAGV